MLVRWSFRPHVVHVPPDGAYVREKNAWIPLKPMHVIGDEGVSYLMPPQMLPADEHEQEEEEPEEPVSDGDVNVVEDLNLALECWNEGAISRRKMAVAMEAKTGRHYSEHQCMSLIKSLKDEGRLNNA